MNFYIEPDYITDKQQFIQITKQLAWMRGSSDVLRSLHEHRKLYLWHVALLSIKTPRLIDHFATTIKQMPPQGTNILKMRRYDT